VFLTTISLQIYIIYILPLRNQFILTLSKLVSFHSIELAGHSDTKFEVTIVWQNIIWQMIVSKESPQTFSAFSSFAS